MKTILFSTILILFSTLTAFSESISIIVNADNPISSISDDSLRDFYLKAKKTWSNGEEVTPLDRNEGSQARKIFLRQVLKKTVEEMQLYWIEKRQKSGESAPQQLASDALVIRLVSLIKGGVGYVLSNELEGKSLEGIRVIKKIQE